MKSQPDANLHNGLMTSRDYDGARQASGYAARYRQEALAQTLL